jgi:hypothetical protein
MGWRYDDCSMRSMHFLTITFRFYSRFVLASGLITVSGLILCSQTTSLSFSAMTTLVKGITNLIIGLLFHLQKSHELFYFNNLGLPTPRLYSYVFVLDMMLWFILLMIIKQV